MKKTIILLVSVMMTMVSFAQSAKELAKEQAELRAINMKILKAKPTKEAKKQAKQLTKEGWGVPVGEKSIERQITESQIYGEELMTDEMGGVTKRFMMQTAVQTAGTYNAGYAAARANAQVELAALLKTEIVAAMQAKLDNAQSSTISTITVDKFNQRSKSIVDETLTNAIPTVVIYRRLQNNNFEVQVRLAFDKKELAARLKRNMRQELEKEGDELEPIVDYILSNKL